jgi:hypothetical protein
VADLTATEEELGVPNSGNVAVIVTHHETVNWESIVFYRAHSTINPSGIPTARAGKSQSTSFLALWQNAPTWSFYLNLRGISEVRAALDSAVNFIFVPTVRPFLASFGCITTGNCTALPGIVFMKWADSPSM